MRGQYQGTRWLECLNTSGYSIPPHSLVTITGATLEDPGRTVLHVDRASADHDYPIAITNHATIAVSDYGLCACEGPVFVNYDSAATPAVGYAWGTAAGSFKATLDKNGLIVLPGIDTIRKLVLCDICRLEGYVNIITFDLAEALEISDESVTATINEQIGIGRKSPYTGAGAITVHNMPSVGTGSYEFYADSGDHGRAAWMYGNHYKILIVECP
jgi:hypothetical protein